MINVWDKQPRNKLKRPRYWAGEIDRILKCYLSRVKSDVNKDSNYLRMQPELVRRLAKREIASLCTEYPNLPPPPKKQDHQLVTVALADQQTWFIQADRIMNANKHKSSLPVLNETDRALAEYIRKHPGQTGDQIVVGMEKDKEFGITIRASSIRKKYSRKLKYYGFHNLRNGDGYFPPPGE
ncbi:MAG: hypothetical protein GY774_30450 [Planctomycetes bacterium]|nr:hypothetical protein [Planctomycetota bacterium]